jgi:hypothetical protein
LDYADCIEGHVMRSHDIPLAQRIDAALIVFHREIRRLPAIQTDANRAALIEQMIESVRRIRYISVIREKRLSPHTCDPRSDAFDPIKAAILRERQGQIDEAFWLVFLFVHFGKNLQTGWRLVRDVYGALGRAATWSWANVIADPQAFSHWLAANQITLQGRDNVRRKFGNHRKYETLEAGSPNGTAAVIESYIRWVAPHRTHQALVSEAQQRSGANARKTFDLLYHSMNVVRRFGRTARFDYLTMLGKLGLAPIEPGIPYMRDATGPLKGATLLFEGSKSARISVSDADSWTAELGDYLGVGMQVMEDSLCNWQKRPDKFVPFRG